MDLVTIALLIAAVWLLGAMAVMAMCRSAAQGDRVLTAQLHATRWTSGTHEHSLAA